MSGLYWSFYFYFLTYKTSSIMPKKFVITEVRGPFTYKNKKTGAEVTKIALNGAEEDQVVFLSPKQVKDKAGVQGNLGVIIGSSVEVEYFAVGDKLHNGEPCDKPDWIAKDVKIIKSKKLEIVSMCGEMGASIDMSKFE